MLTTFIPIPKSLSSDAFFRAQNAPHPFSGVAVAPDPSGKLTTLHQTLQSAGEGDNPSSYRPMMRPFPFDAVGVSIFGASNSVPIFYRTFMVTYCTHFLVTDFYSLYCFELLGE